MPIIIPREREGAWLDPASKPSDYNRLLAPYPSPPMRAYEVSPQVNSGKIDDPRLIEPLE